MSAFCSWFLFNKAAAKLPLAFSFSWLSTLFLFPSKKFSSNKLLLPTTSSSVVNAPAFAKNILLLLAAFVAILYVDEAVELIEEVSNAAGVNNNGTSLLTAAVVKLWAAFGDATEDSKSDSAWLDELDVLVSDEFELSSSAVESLDKVRLNNAVSFVFVALSSLLVVESVAGVEGK